MQRYSPSRARPQTADKDALPERKLILTADRYARLRATSADGSPQLRAAFDEVVSDLVDRHEIVAKDFRQDLRVWLNWSVCAYFERAASKRWLTDKQALACQRNIKELGDALRKELARLYALPAQTVYCDVEALDRILSRARQYQPQGRPTKKENAANLALQSLGGHIGWFWMDNGRGIQEGDLRQPPKPCKSSGYFRFAKYIYAFVGMHCTDPMIIKRLRAAEKCFLGPWREVTEPVLEGATSGNAYYLADGTAVVPLKDHSWPAPLDQVEVCEKPEETANRSTSWEKQIHISSV